MGAASSVWAAWISPRATVWLASSPSHHDQHGRTFVPWIRSKGELRTLCLQLAPQFQACDVYVPDGKDYGYVTLKSAQVGERMVGKAGH